MTDSRTSGILGHEASGSRIRRVHGNFGTVGYSQPDYAYAALGAPSCTSVSAQAVVTTGNRVLVNATRVFDTSVANGAQSTSFIGGGYYIFGTNYWFTRAGVFDELRQMTSFGC